MATPMFLSSGKVLQRQLVLWPSHEKLLWYSRFLHIPFHYFVVSDDLSTRYTKDYSDIISFSIYFNAIIV
jgi:hypothetical protein